ncbi:ArsR/SmtB family transcription factor [Marinicella sediminis]|uniref:ArsR/SmtB family transcription factor n=1 Tax=Marinicella sediminis TaxID=1792834 RepID=A0ABV7JB42_9GAMM|nr:metalloregulator ArsR/SmtB family transcription factor [Marinicella sediminis]
MNLNDVFKTLADESRIRLILLLQQQELTVAELAEITRLAQPRVSTHLSHLKKNHLVQVRKQGVSSYYRLNEIQFTEDFNGILELVTEHYAEHPLIQQDKEQLSLVMASQAASNQWVDAVAGDMERHYSPGRTWEATTRVVSRLANLGRVLDLGSGDGVLAELLAANSEHYVCVDNNNKAIKAAKDRLKHLNNVEFHQADIHQLVLPDNQFDHVLMLHVLTYSDDPLKVIKQAHRVCRPGGQLIINTLDQHPHEFVRTEYGHKNLGFDVTTLKQLCQKAGFEHVNVAVSSQEQRKPHFKIITVEATK